MLESCVINRDSKHQFSRRGLYLNVLKIKFKNGDITLLNQSDLLKEDILQVQYPDDLL